MSTIPISDYKTDFDGLKHLGKEFLDALPTATIEEADAGFKCFSLAYLNGNFDEREALQAAMLLQIISKKFILREVELAGSDY